MRYSYETHTDLLNKHLEELRFELDSHLASLDLLKRRHNQIISILHTTMASQESYNRANNEYHQRILMANYLYGEALIKLNADHVLELSNFLTFV